MLFSEKMTRVPQPDRAALWEEYRTLCSALSLGARLKNEKRPPSEEELIPLKQAATKANGLLRKHGMEASFFPERADFFESLSEELFAIMKTPSPQD